MTDIDASPTTRSGDISSDPPGLLVGLDGSLRAAFPVEESANAELVAHLTDVCGDEFFQRWERQRVACKGTGTKRIVHPDVGELRLAFETLTLADSAPQRLVTHFAADDDKAQRIDHLAGRQPGALHAVGDHPRPHA